MPSADIRTIRTLIMGVRSVIGIIPSFLLVQDGFQAHQQQLPAEEYQDDAQQGGGVVAGAGEDTHSVGGDGGAADHALEHHCFGEQV